MPTTGDLTKGAAFLITETDPERVFTPEDFTQEHQMIIETTRSFVENEILPNAEELEHQNWDLTVSLMKKAGEIGLLAADVPEAFEGLGADKVTSALIMEYLTRGGSFAVGLGGHVGIGTLPIVFFGNEEQKKRYLPRLATGEKLAAYALTEPGSGSDALGAKTTARLSDDGKYYILNGTKQFITNAGFADIFIVYAKIDGEKFSAFIVERDFPGVSTGPEEKKMGIKASSTRPLILEDVHVPVENLLGEPGKGHVIAFNILNIGRYKLAVGSVGGMKAAIETSVKYAKDRKQFRTAIANFPLIQQKLADMNIRCYVTESMSYRSTGDIDARLATLAADADGREAARAIEEYALECSVNKVYASEALDFVVDEAVQIHGGYGFIQDYPVERMYRDSRINRIFEGTNEINRMLIPDMLMRRAMKGDLPLLQAAQGVQEELMGMLSLPDEGEPLGVEKHLIQMAKKVFLFVGGSAVQKYMQSLKEEQEILASLANIIIEIYAAESALLRAEKALARGGEAAAAHKIDMVRLYTREAMTRIEQEAKFILSAMEEGDMLRTQLAVLRKLTRFEPINSRDVKRRIAARVIEAERYLA
ncbi:MAG: acyl-CoA dehydrogenase family protein [Alicyclobacillus herbarius]|uniref:acyl-CoA dehydrogenase family protein n=1 Tax=Alicyclobacillus herbarius TaxID=122960 RepID=UPI000427AB2B|nr:acyl-CoA dehydrogenase family protein [Alicyclobacillus herbarius]MCL6631538.1 acyl-CoA dehydrogenase family protein [Alicyclobacillus herbarius]